MMDCFIQKNDVDLLIIMAGYRNRLVNYYREGSSEGLYDICRIRLGDSEKLAFAFENWMKCIPDLADGSI
jgi:uncharacterized protein YutE (UPF0331/DUF86 family)